MKVQLAGYMKTTTPVDLSGLAAQDTGRYHSIWMPDHMVSFWSDVIWTPEFTDLATKTPSPHRHLDALTMAGAVAALTKNVHIATGVVDTIRRHPAMLAQTTLTLSHLSKGRFILGVGSGEVENTVPYGFDFSRMVSRFEESIKVIRLLWNTDGPVDFEGEFYKLHHARLDTELYDGKAPPIWIAANGPRMLEICGRYGDGWRPSEWSPKRYADKLAQIHASAEKASRDPAAIVPAHLQLSLMADDDAELAEILSAPLVKHIILNMKGADLRSRGFEHPMGDDWAGYVSFDPSSMTRDQLIKVLAKVTPEMIKAFLPAGTPKQVAKHVKQFADNGARVIRMLDYGSMAGLKFAAKSARKVREAEDELLRLVEGI